MRLCARCGRLGCVGHQVRRRSRLYSSRTWVELRRFLIRRHVARYGWTCPGDGAEHPAHASRRLSIDHIVPLALGGAELEPANLRVLCLSRNSALGARLVNARRGGRGGAYKRRARARNTAPSNFSRAAGYSRSVETR